MIVLINTDDKNAYTTWNYPPPSWLAWADLNMIYSNRNCWPSKRARAGFPPPASQPSEDGVTLSSFGATFYGPDWLVVYADVSTTLIAPAGISTDPPAYFEIPYVDGSPFTLSDTGGNIEGLGNVGFFLSPLKFL